MPKRKRPRPRLQKPRRATMTMTMMLRRSEHRRCWSRSLAPKKMRAYAIGLGESGVQWLKDTANAILIYFRYTVGRHYLEPIGPRVRFDEICWRTRPGLNTRDQDDRVLGSEYLFPWIRPFFPTNPLATAKPNPLKTADDSWMAIVKRWCCKHIYIYHKP